MIYIMVFIYFLLVFNTVGQYLMLCDQRKYFNKKEQETKRRCKELYRRVTNGA